MQFPDRAAAVKSDAASMRVKRSHWETEKADEARDLQVRIRLRVLAQNAPPDLGRCCRSSFFIWHAMVRRVSRWACAAPVLFLGISKYRKEGLEQ